VIGTNSSGSVLGGGYQNEILDTTSYSVLGGGAQNVVGSSAFYATLSGGWLNGIGSGGDFSTIGGGRTNRIQAAQSVIAGGSENTVGVGSTFCAIGGGSGNVVADSTRTVTIAGGGRNRVEAGAIRSFIGGGVDHRIGSGAEVAVIGGGSTNVIEAGSVGAVIPGGISNRVAGAHAMAAGYRAQAQATGVFAWADATDSDFVAGTANEFAVRATGGVRLVTAVDSTGLPLAGVSVAPGSGSWGTLSDANAKQGFEAVDAGALLRQLESMPIQSWSYRTEPSGARHLGPTAQDFHTAFGLGGDSQSIATVDADGVALATIQELYRLVRQQQAELDTLRDRLQRLEAAKPDGS
jgi:hypothetical protein